MRDIDPREVTPEHLFLSRRRFIKGTAAVAAGAWLAGCGLGQSPDPEGSGGTAATPGHGRRHRRRVGRPAHSLRRRHRLQQLLRVHPDQGRRREGRQGLPHQPLDGRSRPAWSSSRGRSPSRNSCSCFPDEERIYRMRCVEAWSMVIPWLGFPLRNAPGTGQAHGARRSTCAFEAILDPEDMPGQAPGSGFSWPYVEGLRLDEAMNDLTLLSTGLYGKRLLPQNGAPLRLVVPWKYGFKSIKSIVRINLVEHAARHLLDGGVAERVRVLRQRQPQRRPPPLVAGHRASHRRERSARDADVQRLRGRGGAALRGHGPRRRTSDGRRLARGGTDGLDAGPGRPPRPVATRRPRVDATTAWRRG